MRLDLFLKLSRLIKTRSLARDFAKKGLVEINGNTAKPSSTVSEGDELIISRADSRTTVRVVEVPKKKQVSKKNASGLYEPLAHEKLDPLKN